MILTPAQALACVYALDTNSFCVHLTICPDIDVQKLNSGCVIVEGANSSEQYSNVLHFIQAYALPVEQHPLIEVAKDLEHHRSAHKLGKWAWWIVAALVIAVGLIVWRL